MDVAFLGAADAMAGDQVTDAKIRTMHGPKHSANGRHSSHFSRSHPYECCTASRRQVGPRGLGVPGGTGVTYAM
ncbi:hypothetical protein T261_8293 [Streptomyces lydicus]|nr:hypothetical protein T261_8293 [Streptomyces lydicus]